MPDITKLPKEEQQAILARREYYKKWRKANADKVRAANKRYWLKKAKKENA
ncbi:MAG TPA: phosphatase [Ruminococcus sp.]|nr:phosphatase [Ruminococcus sp.]